MSPQITLVALVPNHSGCAVSFSAAHPEPQAQGMFGTSAVWVRRLFWLGAWAGGMAVNLEPWKSLQQ